MPAMHRSLLTHVMDKIQKLRVTAAVVAILHETPDQPQHRRPCPPLGYVPEASARRVPPGKWLKLWPVGATT